MTINSGFPLLLIVAIFAVADANSFQREFIRSFLKRPWMLSNRSVTSLPSKPVPVTVTVMMDNWSTYDFSVGTGSQSARNVNPMDRNLVEQTSNPDVSSGIIGWHLIDRDGGNEVARLTLAWKAFHDGQIQFGVGLGKYFLTKVDQVLQDQPQPSNERMVIGTSSKLVKEAIIIEQFKLVVVFEASKDNNTNNGFLLKASVLPANIDVWGWVKYFRNKFEATTVSTMTTVTHRTKSKKSPGNFEQVEDDPKSEKPGIFERKDLLPKSTLEQKTNLSIRDALLSQTGAYWVAVGLHIENWSRHRLVQFDRQFESGKVLRDVQVIGPGSQEVVIVTHEEGSLSGTLGLIRFKIDPWDSILSVMWSVPYNRQLWQSWAAVALTGLANAPNIEEMYSGMDPTRFVRKKSGRKFDFSDGRFVVVAEMDGGSTYKPVLRVGVVPMEKKELANSIKRQLGLPLHKSQPSHQNNEPQAGLVQSTSSTSSSTLISLTLYITILIVLRWIV